MAGAIDNVIVFDMSGARDSSTTRYGVFFPDDMDLYRDEHDEQEKRTRCERLIANEDPRGHRW